MLQGVRAVGELRDSARSIESLIREHGRAEPLSVVQLTGTVPGEAPWRVTCGKAFRGMQGRIHFQPQYTLTEMVVEVVYGPALISDVIVGRDSCVGTVGLMRRVECFGRRLQVGNVVRVDLTELDPRFTH